MSCARTLLAFVCPLAAALAQNPAPKPGGEPPPMPKISLSVENPASTPAALPDVPPDTVVIAIGDEKLTAGEFATLVEALPEQYRVMARGTGRRQFGENIVRVRILLREARRLKLDQDPKFKALAAFNTDSLLANLTMQRLTESVPLDDAVLRKYFEDRRSEYERVRARHILVRMKGSPVPITPGQGDLSEEEALAKAQEIRKKILAGADFAKTAETASDDAGSRASGGDLNFFRRGQMVPSFEEAAFKLKAGEISEPVKSPFGFHIIKVEQRDVKSFEELKPEIEKRLRPEMAQKAVEDLKTKAGVTLDPMYFAAPSTVVVK